MAPISETYHRREGCSSVLCSSQLDWIQTMPKRFRLRNDEVCKTFQMLVLDSRYADGRTPKTLVKTFEKVDRYS